MDILDVCEYCFVVLVVVIVATTTTTGCSILLFLTVSNKSIVSTHPTESSDGLALGGPEWTLGGSQVAGEGDAEHETNDRCEGCEGDNNNSNNSVVVDVMAKGNVTPLQLCIWQGHVECTRYLIETCHADYCTLETGWGCTLCHWLAKTLIYFNAGKGNEGEKDDQEQEQDADTIISDSSAWHRIWTLCEYLTTTKDLQQSLNDNNNKNYCCCCCCWTMPNHQGQTPLHKAAFAETCPYYTI